MRLIIVGSSAVVSRTGLRKFIQNRTLNSEMRRNGIIALVLLLASLGSQGRAQSVPRGNALRVLAQGEVGTFWEVREAGFEESLTGTSGYIKLQNMSKFSIEDAVLYGEYFDSEGRYCFSLVFSQEQNLTAKGPIAQNEIRELNSSSVGLFAASEPKEVKLYLVQQTVMEQPISSQKWAVVMRAPVTGGGTVDANAPKLQLGPEVAVSLRPISDLMLASVTVNEQGSIQKVETIGSLSADVEKWCLNVIRQQQFYPAMDGDSPKANKILVLVRADLSTPTSDNSHVPSPRALPWVQSYVTRIAQSEVPVVTQILLGRPSSKVKQASDGSTGKPPAISDSFQVKLHGSEWSSPAFHWVSDQTMPNHLRRVLTMSVPR